MTNFNTIIEDALGLPKPWHVQKVEYDKDKPLLRVYVSFERGSRFVVEGQDKPLPVYDTQEKLYRYSNCFTHECVLVVQLPRVKLPDGKVKTVRPPAGAASISLEDRDGFIWMDGQMVVWRDATVHVLTHSLHYGTAVFEGVRAYQTPKGLAIFRLDAHTDRLLDSAKILCLPVEYGADELKKAQRQVVAANKLESAYIRPLLYYGAEDLGLNVRKNRPHAAIAAWTWKNYLSEEGKGIRVKTSSYLRHHPAVTMCRGKISGHYVNSVLAHSEAVSDGYVEALQLDTDGYISEGSGENLFLVFNGSLVTPELGTCLAGITRQTIIELAAEEGIPCTERRLTRDEVYLADEAFFTGTAAEIVPIKEVDGRLVGSGNRRPVTELLQKLFSDCVCGKDKRHSDWLTLVGD